MINFNCRDCKRQNLKQEEMARHKFKFTLSTGRGICKACITIYNRTNQMIVAANRNPEHFSTCMDCDSIFSKYKRGPIQKNGERKYKTNCPHCNSTNLEGY